MNKKVIILNASPRKNKNTATLLKEAQKGAESTGAEVEYVNLIDLNYKGCMSCFACKLKGNKCNGLCAYKDELRPLLERILKADVLILGSPVYFHFPTGMFRNLMERLLFPVLSYNSNENGGVLKYLEKKLATGLIFTMNCTPENAEIFNYPTILNTDHNSLIFLFGHCEVLNSYNTWQFPDYPKYDTNAVDIAEKERYRDTQFPKDKESAFNLGKRLAEMEL